MTITDNKGFKKIGAKYREISYVPTLRAFIALIILISLYTVVLTQPQFAVMALLTYSTILLYFGLNVLHESCHGNLSSKKWLNDFFAMGFDLFLGISSQQYKVKHSLHHAYTNIDQLDNDLDTDGAIRLSPVEAWKPIHRYQHLYAVFLYGLITVTWGPYYDLKRLMQGRIGKSKYRYKKQDVYIQLLLKFVHYFLFLALPYSIYGANALLAFFITHYFIGIVIALIFQVAHVTKDCAFYDEDKKVSSWNHHQLETTANFATESAFANFFFGGLNYQVIHHIYPSLSYIHLPKVHRELKALGHPIIEYKSFWCAVNEHFIHLKKLGQKT